MVEPRQSGAGIYGVFCLFTPLHAPRSHIHSSRCVQQYISYSSTYMRWYRVCSCIVHGCTATQHALVPKLQLPVLGFPFFYDSPPSRGASDPSPGEPLDAPRSPRWSSASALSPSCERAVVWGGRGAAARPREAKWSSGVTAVFGVYYKSSTLFWVCYNNDIFKESNDVCVLAGSSVVQYITRNPHPKMDSEQTAKRERRTISWPTAVGTAVYIITYLLVKRGVAGVNDPRTERCMAGERVEGSEEERGIYISSSINIGVYYQVLQRYTIIRNTLVYRYTTRRLKQLETT